MTRQDQIDSWPVSALKGAAMGLVELVPGVSAGTVALAAGIYKTLITTINQIMRIPAAIVRHITPGVKSPQVQPLVRAVPWRFIVPLVIGMAASILTFSHLIETLLIQYPGQCLAFFSGVVLASLSTPLRLMKRRGGREMAVACLAAPLSYLVLGVDAGEGSAVSGGWFLFVSGAVAVSVMLLPGVSGSFVLLLLGVYQDVVGYVRGLSTGDAGASILPLAIFSLGVVVGLATTSRLLTWLLDKQPDLTSAALIGVMLGSLRRLWPFLDPSAQQSGVTIDQLAKLGILEISRLPAQELASIAGFAVLGALVVVGQALLGQKTP